MQHKLACFIRKVEPLRRQAAETLALVGHQVGNVGNVRTIGDARAFCDAFCDPVSHVVLWEAGSALNMSECIVVHWTTPDVCIPALRSFALQAGHLGGGTRFQIDPSTASLRAIAAFLVLHLAFPDNQNLPSHGFEDATFASSRARLL
jgi:hypothetical protein